MSFTTPLLPPIPKSSPPSPSSTSLTTIISSVTDFSTKLDSIELDINELEAYTKDNTANTVSIGGGGRKGRRDNNGKKKERLSCLIDECGEKIPQLHTLFQSSSSSSTSILHSRTTPSTTSASATITGESTLGREERSKRREFNEERRRFQEVIKRYTMLCGRFDSLLSTSDSVRWSANSRGTMDGSFVSYNDSITGGGGSFVAGRIGEDEEEEHPLPPHIQTFTTTDPTSQIVESRARDIEVISRNVKLVNSTYQDLANLVEEQGVEIDDIEQNILMSRERTAAGNEQLRKATEFQKSSGKCAKIIIAIVIVGAIVCIGILYGGRIKDSFS
mmetsp:Transcript_14367/g.29579  ORF Transcript_14367/g.29579 Transcript_14367/m.29579 type:complete len:332 (+) Transcript_14367:83-1078(+)